ncbi:MAG: class I tRNA ligase family protein [Anaplasmataceae bacterium]|nr:class I tRNA ligase family protein [Anaplasmataceae bacterium]
MKYKPQVLEKKWQKIWEEEGIYEPNLDSAKNPFYNLMMFPYPSAEGLHVGNVFTFTGVDVYGRFKRLQGYDVFEPIGLDGFGIHSENYALKVGRHPAAQAKISQKNFYNQLSSIGNGFAWKESLETYNPEYYRWTQWIFVQMFKHGLAYRKAQEVNWCPSCKTVLADEQVEGGRCERCSTIVIKKNLEQWFFKITDYAEKLLKDLDNLDWADKIKIAQRNWIGRSEGALLDFPLDKKTPYIFLHGYLASPQYNFWPWLKKELEFRGGEVVAPKLPNAGSLEIDKKVDHVLKTCHFTKDTVLVAHSLGCVVALKLLTKIKTPIEKVVLIAPPSPQSIRPPRIDREKFWGKISIEAAKKKARNFVVIAEEGDKLVPFAESLEVAKKLKAEFIQGHPDITHFMGKESETILNATKQSVSVFTTRPDTIYGATYLVLAPEHPLLRDKASLITNKKEVDSYVKKVTKKSDDERVAVGREKTGVELKGLKAINPASGESISIWVADYVLGGYGTGAIMAVPAHDERDFEFAKKFKLPTKTVISPTGQMFSVHHLESPYEAEGVLINSGDLDGLTSTEAKTTITKKLHGKSQVRYRLRDWLISRQRYWGPPIPMIFCEECKAKNKGEKKNMPGWYSVPEKDLPVRLPLLKDFRPKGTGQSPLANSPDFIKVRCPQCKAKARRETDVSDTFLDSAWYYFRYLDPHNKKSALNAKRVKKWLPVSAYIGGAEHAVLHLLYVRFLAKAFYDWKLIHFKEPAKVFRANGLLTRDGAKISKSKGNIIIPDDFIKQFGIDAFRMHLMFLGPFEEGGDFRDTGILGQERFLKEVWDYFEYRHTHQTKTDTKHPSYIQLRKALHKLLKKSEEDYEKLKFNTIIAGLMTIRNILDVPSAKRGERDSLLLTPQDAEIFLKILAPLAPFITEEIWRSFLGKKTSVHTSPWPKHDPKLLIDETKTIAIQINGKVRASVEISLALSESEVTNFVQNSPKVKSYLQQSKISKVIYVPGRLINFVIEKA